MHIIKDQLTSISAALTRRLALCLVASLSIALTAQAKSKTPATDFLKERVASVLALTIQPAKTAKERAKIDAKLLGVIKPMMDFPAMSEASLGKRWSTLKEDQKKRFMSLFQDLVFHSYMKKIRSAKNEAKIEYEDETARPKGGAEVEAIATTSKDVEVELRFVLRSGDSAQSEAHFVAENVVIDEVSLVDNYREEFSRIIAKEGFNGLLKKMERQVQKHKG